MDDLIARANDRFSVVSAHRFDQERGRPFSIRVRHNENQTSTTAAFSVAEAAELCDALQRAIDFASAV